MCLLPVWTDPNTSQAICFGRTPSGRSPDEGCWLPSRPLPTQGLSDIKSHVYASPEAIGSFKTQGQLEVQWDTKENMKVRSGVDN